MKILLIPCLLLVSSCGVDVASRDNTSTTVDNSDNSVTDTTQECQYECSPVEGGFMVSFVCDGLPTEGPDLVEILPTGCNVDTASTEEPVQE